MAREHEQQDTLVEQILVTLPTHSLDSLAQEYAQATSTLKDNWTWSEFVLKTALKQQHYVLEHSELVWNMLQKHNIIELETWEKWSDFLSPLADKQSSIYVFSCISVDGFLTQPKFMHYCSVLLAMHERNKDSRVSEIVSKASKRHQLRLNALLTHQAMTGNVIFTESLLIVQRPMNMLNAFVPYKDIVSFELKNTVSVKYMREGVETEVSFGVIGQSTQSHVQVGILRNLGILEERAVKMGFAGRKQKDAVMRKVFEGFVRSEALLRAKFIFDFESSPLVVGNLSEERFRGLFEQRALSNTIFGEFDDKRDLREGFDPKVLGDSIRRLERNLKPVFLSVLVIKYLERWENGILSAFVWSVCMYLSVYKLVQYIPAVICLANAFCLASFFLFPAFTVSCWNSFVETMEQFQERIEVKQQVVESEADVENSSFWRSNAIAQFWRKGKDVLGGLQNSTLSMNHRIDQFKGIYCWTSRPHSVIVLSAFLCMSILLFLIPFHILFGLFSFGFFFDYWITSNPDKVTRSQQFINTIPPLSS